MRAADLAELVRLPAALTVPGDALTGAAWAGTPGSGRSGAAMPVASTLLYWGGMALNDWCDRAVDARERPERPIPSGRVGATTAASVAGGLLASGLAASALTGGPRALRVSAPLAGLVWAYDAVAKDSPAGPVVMASTRALDVLLGAHASPRSAWRPASAVAAHTVAVTSLSRGEVHGTRPGTALAACAVTALTATATAVGALRDPALGRRERLAATALAAAYAVTVGRAQAAAAADPAAGPGRAATRTGIGGLTLLQAAWLARRGRLGEAAVVAGALPALQVVSRRMSTT